MTDVRRSAAAGFHNLRTHYILHLVTLSLDVSASVDYALTIDERVQRELRVRATSVPRRDVFDRHVP